MLVLESNTTLGLLATRSNFVSASECFVQIDHRKQL
jgi:hypothetical protein